MTRLNQAKEEVPTASAHQRHGDCHRCGWAQSLQKVTMRRSSGSLLDRAEGLVRGSAWLCDECAAECSTQKDVQRLRSTPRVQYPKRSSQDRITA